MDGEERAMRQAFIRHLIANIQCVSCGEGYARNDIYVLGHHEDVWVSAVVCSRCGTQGLVFASVREGEGVEVRSRGSAEEVGLQHLPALTIDDVLDVHAFLKGFQGDVSALFEQTHEDSENRPG